MSDPGSNKLKQPKKPTAGEKLPPIHASNITTSQSPTTHQPSSFFDTVSSSVPIESFIKNKYVARTTKNNPKLVVFPSDSESNQNFQSDLVNNNSSVSDQGPSTLNILPEQMLHQMETPPSRTLKRVTAYCLADALNLKTLKEYLDKKSSKFSIKTQRYDEVLYSPYSHYESSSPLQKSGQKNADRLQPVFSFPSPVKTGPFISTHPSALTAETNDFGKSSDPTSVDQFYSRYLNVAHLFFFEYGVLVAWGLTLTEETYLLNEMRLFATETLSEDDMEEEALQFCHDPNSTARVFGDIIILKQDHFFVKLTISHALAQSVKLSVFEERLEKAISSTQPIPQLLASTGKVNLSNSQINKKIGQLFVLRIHINLISNVLDTPEIFWSQRQWESLYKAARTYFEIPQRVEVLNQRTAVISDLLEMLKDHMTSSHGEFLEWIVIFLIAFEVIMGIIEIYIMVTTKHFP